MYREYGNYLKAGTDSFFGMAQLALKPLDLHIEKVDFGATWDHLAAVKRPLSTFDWRA